MIDPQTADELRRHHVNVPGTAATTTPAPDAPTDAWIAKGNVEVAAKFVAASRHSDGPRIRRWRGEWYFWADPAGHYMTMSDEQVDRLLYRKLGLGTRKEVSEVRHAMIACDDVLIDHVPLGHWTGTPTLVADPLNVIATRSYRR